MTAAGARTTKQRLDVALVERGLAPTRQTAQALIMSGSVCVEGLTADKPGIKVPAGADITVRGSAPAYASRGGLKLAGALESFGLEVTGLTALDVGASTGGFTDCLLKHGAARVIALDVGRGQLAWRLRGDPRVVVLEGINARGLSASDLPADAAIDMAVVDVSFISLRLVLPRLPPLLRTDRPGSGVILALIKPQFEVGRGQVGRGGIVRDADLRLTAVEGIAEFATAQGLAVRGLAASRLAGAEGNREYFAHLSVRDGGLTREEVHERALEITRMSVCR